MAVTFQEITDLPYELGGNPDAIHIVYVDDDHANLQSFRLQAMRSFKGNPNNIIVHMGTVSEDVLEILKQADRTRVILVTDNDMPGSLSGTELAVFLREIDKDLPIAVYTGRPDAAKESGKLPEGISVFDKIKIGDMFKEYVLPAVAAILEQPVRTVTPVALQPKELAVG